MKHLFELLCYVNKKHGKKEQRRQWIDVDEEFELLFITYLSN